MTMIFTDVGQHGGPVWGAGSVLQAGSGVREVSELCSGSNTLTFHPAKDDTLADEFKNYFFNNFLWVLFLVLFCSY